MPIVVPAQVQYADVSQWQTSFDPVSYPYPKISLRATYGTTGTDPTFAARWASSSHLTRQAYDFAYPGDPVIAAEHFLEVVASAGGFNPGDEAMLDLEQLGVTPQQAAQLAPVWCRIVQTAQPSVRVLIYGNEWFIAAARLTPAELPNVGLIVASYGAGPQTPPGWDHVCIWQYADNATVPGFPAPVDINQVICPSNLDHLTIGDELVMDAAATKAFADLQNEVALTSTFMSQRFDRIDKTLQIIYRGIPGDDTHPGLTTVIAKIDALAAQPAPTGSDAAELKTVLDNFLADLHGLNWTVGIK